MKIPRVKQCCCGCSLQTGCKIIGYYQLISAIVVCFLNGGILYLLSSDEKLLQDVKLEEDLKNDLKNDLKDVTFVIKIILGIMILLTIVTIIFNILLIVGATKEIRRFLTIWLIYTLVALCISILTSITYIAETFKGNETQNGLREVFTLIIRILLTLYFCIVVHSYSKEIKLRDQRQKMEMMT